MTFIDACLYSVTGLLVVFFALILLMAIIKIMTAVGDSAEKKAALAAAAAAPAAAPAPAAEPAKAETSPSGVAGPKYTRELKLWDTDPRDAAMIMAIVAETTRIPLNQLQFLSIKEIKGDNHE